MKECDGCGVDHTHNEEPLKYEDWSDGIGKIYWCKFCMPHYYNEGESE